METNLKKTSNFSNTGVYRREDINKKKGLILETLSKLNQSEKEEYLIYLINREEEEDDNEGNESDDDYLIEEEDIKIRLFGEEFVKNNKDNCKIFINGKEEKITEFYSNKSNEDIIKVKLIFTKKISDLSHMFNGCFSLINLPTNMSKWDISNVNNINYMFNGCTELFS